MARFCTCVAILATFVVGLPLSVVAQRGATKAPQGLPAMKTPKDNAVTAAKVALGKQLFFDKRLSSDNTVSCASCHDPKHGWSNGERFATGVRGQVGGRSAPTIVNAGYSHFQFWDGRAKEVEGQALGPIANPIEMDMPLDKLVKKLTAIKGYDEQFRRVFSDGVTQQNIAKAIAAFERTIVSGDAPYDRHKAGNKDALSDSAKRGMKVFFNKAQCSSCHPAPHFTDHAFHNLGVGMDKEKPDVGRFAVTKLLGDRGSFKTPTLREIARTAPYMHDGSLPTLEDVVEFYSKGGIKNAQQSEDIFPLKLSKEEKKDLIQFLKEGLSSESYPDVKPPELPK